MADFLAGIHSWDYATVTRRLEAFGDAEAVGEAELLALLSHVPALPTRYPAPSTVAGPGIPATWHQYENLIWALGERCRGILKRHRKLRKSPALWDRVESLALDPAYGKGRESFVMLLGQYGGRGRIPVLLRLLDDPEVQGHALYALRLLGAPDAAARARALLRHPRTLVRNEAKKYLAKIGQPSAPDVAT